jgi:hypothetical protein
VEAVENPAAGEHGPGAVPPLPPEPGCGRCDSPWNGEACSRVFEQLGIRVIVGAEGRVGELVESFARGTLASREYKPKERWRIIGPEENSA